MQFIANITANIESFTGSPVLYKIINATDGSVTYYSECIFEDGSSAGAEIYETALTSSPQDFADIFGSDYEQLYGDVTVDPSTVSTASVANPSRKSPWQPLYNSAIFAADLFHTDCWSLLIA